VTTAYHCICIGAMLWLLLSDTCLITMSYLGMLRLSGSVHVTEQLATGCSRWFGDRGGLGQTAGSAVPMVMVKLQPTMQTSCRLQSTTADSCSAGGPWMWLGPCV
jgi:hypothetical protein